MGFFDRLRFESQKWAKTLAVVPQPMHLQNMGLVEPSFTEAIEDGSLCQEVFKIRLAHNARLNQAAELLVERRYKEKGYYSTGSPALERAAPKDVTLTIYKGQEMFGTLSLGFDRGEGLFVDEIYKSEIDELRRAGRRVCEFTKLAIDHKRTSKRVLAVLFHVAFMYTERIWGYTDIVIEVTPAHAVFYRRMLGFEIFGPVRVCPRVNIQGVLLRGDTAWGREMVRKYGGRPELAKEERTLFPYFLSQEDEDSLLDRIRHA